MHIGHPNRLTVVEGHPVGTVLARIRAGDQDAFASLYRTLYTILWRIAILVTRSAPTAEEIVQDVFLTLWDRRETLDVDADIRVYLAAAVRNRAHDLSRHRTVYTDAVCPRSTEPAATPPMPASITHRYHAALRTPI